MSEVKGMKIYMAADPQEDGAFFIKKSTRDGSLAVFDEEINAARQVKINDDNTELREGFIVSDERKKKIERQIERLTDIATKHATRADELYEALDNLLELIDSCEGLAGINRSQYIIEPNELSAVVEAKETLDKSRIESEKGDGICN